VKNQHFLQRLGYAWAGIRSALRSERSLRTQAAVGAAVIPALLILRPALIWWALVGITVALVLAAELINTALEHLADHLHPEQHPRIKIVKDCAAGAVLVLSAGAVWVGVLAVWSTFAPP
jgi:diacylglycerol kinase (ATP)